jgi:hypothetical protein
MRTNVLPAIERVINSILILLSYLGQPRYGVINADFNTELESLKRLGIRFVRLAGPGDTKDLPTARSASRQSWREWLRATRPRVPYGPAAPIDDCGVGTGTWQSPPWRLKGPPA